MAMSLVVLVGDIAVRVMLPTVAGAASPAVFAEVVAADAISLADAEMVTVGVADLADAGTWLMLGYRSRPTLLGLSP